MADWCRYGIVLNVQNQLNINTFHVDAVSYLAFCTSQRCALKDIISIYTGLMFNSCSYAEINELNSAVIC